MLAPTLVLLHGFLDTPRVWDLVVPALRKRFEVLAPALPGHAGGPALDGDVVDAVERLLPDGPVHLAGNSLGGHLALKLAERGRARSVVALAPAGGWEALPRELFAQQRALAAAPRGPLTDEALRRGAKLIAERTEHIPVELLADQVAGMAAVDAGPLIDAAVERDWSIEPERIECPVRIVWGTADRLLPWPAAAARLRRQLPHADWVVLDGVGHCPQLDVPAEAAELIGGFSYP